MLTVPSFENARVLVVGDIMLDRYWYGDTGRISPEAPVPVVRIADEERRLGGAANVALNLARVGAKKLRVGLADGSGLGLRPPGLGRGQDFRKQGAPIHIRKRRETQEVQHGRPDIDVRDAVANHDAGIQSEGKADDQRHAGAAVAGKTGVAGILSALQARISAILA